MENEHEVALKEYMESTLNRARQRGWPIKTVKSWVFGAIDFNYHAGLIDGYAYTRLVRIMSQKGEM